jgi:hypothetical protein
MEQIISILKSTQGVFASTLKQNTEAAIKYPVPYIGIGHDKQNLRNDMLHFLSDFRNAVDEVKVSQ